MYLSSTLLVCRSVRLTVLVCLGMCVASLGAADSEVELIKDEDIPDPFGLGPRLALIDLLKEQYDVTAEPGASLQQLKEQYAALQPEQGPTANEQARWRELVAELQKYGVEPAEGDTVETLESVLAHHRNEDKRLAKEAAKAKWGDVGSTRMTTAEPTTFALGPQTIRMLMPHGYEDFQPQASTISNRHFDTRYFGSPSDNFQTLLVALRHREQVPANMQAEDALGRYFRKEAFDRQVEMVSSQWRTIGDARYLSLVFKTIDQGRSIMNNINVRVYEDYMYGFAFIGVEENFKAKSASMAASLSSIEFISQED